MFPGSGRIAQLVEQLTLNQRVPGSSPGAPTIALKILLHHPHHHYPSPFANPAYGQLDLRTVARYRWVVDSVCLSLVGGRLQRRVIGRSAYDLGPVESK